MKKELLLIDGNNMGYRNAFAHTNLSVPIPQTDDDIHPDQIMDEETSFPTGVLHGFFQSLKTLRTLFPNAFMVIIWDGGNNRRRKITDLAVEKGIVTSGYKANRKKGEIRPEVEAFLKQQPILKEMISYTNIPQLCVKEEEADDIIASYAHAYSDKANVIACTSDKDFYQLLDKAIVLKANPKRGEQPSYILYDDDDLHSQFKVTPSQWIDVGAMAGDSGDNIIGPPSWGETTALKLIREHGDYKTALENFHDLYDRYRDAYPDLTEPNEIKELKSFKNKKGDPVYPDIWTGQPFTGMALALERKQLKIKINKRSFLALMYEPRIHLAYELKKMITDIEVPKLPRFDRGSPEKLIGACQTYNLKSVASEADKFCALQP